METAYLETNYCGDGMFSDECSVGLSNYNRNRVSGFFPRNRVKLNKLEVEVHEESGELVMIKVPGRIIEGDETAGSGNVITVNKDSLSYLN